MSEQSVARAEAGEWARLSPLSPVIKAGTALGALVVLFGIRTAQAQGTHERNGWVNYVVDGAILLIGIVAATTSWAVTKWRIADGQLQVDTGLIRKQSVRLPLQRMQAVDIVRPVLARFFGLAEVRAVVAGGGNAQGRLAYLREEQAEEVRAKLLAISHGLHEETPAPVDENVLVTTDNGRLVASALLTQAMVLLVAFVVVLVVLGVTIGGSAISATVFSLIAVLFALLQAIFRRVTGEFSQTVAESGDGLRIRGGLLQTRAETVPFARLQALRWSEPLLWRPFGWCRIELDVARQKEGNKQGDQRETGAMARALLPVGPRADGARLLDGFLSGVTAEDGWRNLPPSRARWKAPLLRRHLGLWWDERVVVIGSGRVRRQTVVVPLHKIQSLRLTQGPWARALSLKTLDVDLVGRRWSLSVRCRDAAEADRLIEELSAAARAARATASAAGTPIRTS